MARFFIDRPIFAWVIAIVIVLVSVTPVVISAMINWRKSKKTPAQELMED